MHFLAEILEDSALCSNLFPFHHTQCEAICTLLWAAQSNMDIFINLVDCLEFGFVIRCKYLVLDFSMLYIPPYQLEGFLVLVFKCNLNSKLYKALKYH